MVYPQLNALKVSPFKFQAFFDCDYKEKKNKWEHVGKTIIHSSGSPQADMV